MHSASARAETRLDFRFDLLPRDGLGGSVFQLLYPSIQFCGPRRRPLRVLRALDAFEELTREREPLVCGQLERALKEVVCVRLRHSAKSLSLETPPNKAAAEPVVLAAGRAFVACWRDSIREKLLLALAAQRQAARRTMGMSHRDDLREVRRRKWDPITCDLLSGNSTFAVGRLTKHRRGVYIGVCLACRSTCLTTCIVRSRSAACRLRSFYERHWQ